MGDTQPPATPEEKNEALKVVERAGVPYNQALLVVKGTASLNDVIKEMKARERRDSLIAEGVPPSLAGQVARGRLPATRARTIKDLWEAQKAPFRSDRLVRHVGGRLLAVSLFGRGVVGGTVSKVTRYDILLRPEGFKEDIVMKKHEVKFFCLAREAADVLPRIGHDPKVAALSLGSTPDVRDRFRPTEDLALDWVVNRRRLRLVFRDGESMTGIPTRVARFEIDLDLGDDVRATLMTHALFKPQPYRHCEGDG